MLEFTGGNRPTIIRCSSPSIFPRRDPRINVSLCVTSAPNSWRMQPMAAFKVAAVVAGCTGPVLQSTYRAHNRNQISRAARGVEQCGQSPSAVRTRDIREERADRRTWYPSKTPRRQFQQWVDSSTELIIPIHFGLYSHWIPDSGVLHSEPFVLIFTERR